MSGWPEGVVYKSISISQKYGDKVVEMQFGYYSLPGDIPKALFMYVSGGGRGKTSIVSDLPDVFTKRYGEPQEKNKNPGMVWLSASELATVDNSSLTIISKAGYEELFGKYIAGVKAEQDAKKKAEEEQRKAQENAVRDKL